MVNKKNKGIIVIFVILLIIIISLIGYFVYQNIYIGNKNNYQLKKFADYSENIIEGNMVYDGEFYVLEGKNSSSSWLFNNVDAWKNGKNIFSLHNKKFIQEHSGNFYISIDNFSQNQAAKFIDYANLGLSNESYDSITYLYNDYFQVKKSDRSYIIDKSGNEISNFMKYKDIVLSRSKKYLIVTDDNNKKGIIDLSGKIVVPIEYDSVFCFQNDKYFYLSKDNVDYVVDTSNKVLLQNKDFSSVIYDERISKFVVVDYDNNGEVVKCEDPVGCPDVRVIKKLDFYSLEGEYIKSVNFDKNLIYYATYGGDYDNYDINGYGAKTLIKYNSMLSLVGNTNSLSQIHIFNNDLQFKTINNIYYINRGCQGTCIDYYMTNDIYVTKTNDVYKIHSMTDDKEIYDKDFSYVEWFKDKLFVCDDNACYFLNEKGERIDKIDYSKDFANKDIYDFYNGNVLIENSIMEYDLYNNSYKKLNDKKLINVYEVDEFVITQNKDNNDILIYDNNKLVEYENLDNAKLKLYLGKANGYLFFLTDKGIYNIQID